MEENDAPLALFLAVQTQWRTGPTGRPVGMDYPGIEAAARMRGDEMTPELFRLMQAMEMTALNTSRERSDAD